MNPANLSSTHLGCGAPSRANFFANLACEIRTRRSASTRQDREGIADAAVTTIRQSGPHPSRMDPAVFAERKRRTFPWLSSQPTRADADPRRADNKKILSKRVRVGVCHSCAGQPKTIAFATVEDGHLVLRRGAVILAKLAVANLLCESARSSSCATHMVTLKVCEDGFQEADSLYFDCGDASRVEAFTLMLADGIRSS